MLDRRALIEARGSKWIVKLDDSALGINNNYERRAGAQIGVDLVVDVDATVVGRKNLDGDIWRERRHFQLLVAQRAQAIV